MSFETSFLDPGARGYVARLVDPPFPDLLRRMEEEIEREEQPAVGRAVGSLLRALAAGAQAHRALEVGCNLGYSALWIAAGMAPGGRLDTIEMEDPIADRAEAHFREAGLHERVRVHRGRALDVLPRLQGPYDLVFLDAAKAEYPQYLDHAARLLRPGGILAADNAFWRGAVWGDKDDPDTRGVRDMTRSAFSDSRWVSTLVPSEDGVLVAVKVS